MVSALASKFLDKMSRKAALVSALSYHHRLDVANLRSAVGREVGAPFCIPLRLGGSWAKLSLIRHRPTTIRLLITQIRI